jgi:RNA polymerase sigma factor (TIGR02999 family)
MLPCNDITELLDRWRSGQPEAFEKLVPAIYDQLHRVAASYLSRERADHTLQATGLVNEVFLKLLNSQGLKYKDRSHFYAFAAKLMRRILVDHARRYRSQKRAGGAERVTLAPELQWVDVRSGEMLDLDTALDDLGQLDETAVRMLELRYFLGTTSEETAELLGISRGAVDRCVRFSLSWLHARLTEEPEA